MKMLNKIYIIAFIVLLSTMNCKSQTQSERLASYTNEIIGVWQSNNDSEIKIEFTSNGLLKSYYQNLIDDDIDTYSLSINCGVGGNNGFDIWFKQIMSDGDTKCHIINNITTISNGDILLSITTNRGKLTTYTKQ